MQKKRGDMKEMKCKFCGEEIEQPKRGRKREYCNKEGCLRQAKNEANRKWYANKMNKELKGVKHRIVNKEEKKIIYSSTDKIMNITKNEDFSDVLELARELGAVRYKITEKIKSLSPEQSRADKQDEVFLHNIEDLTKQDEISEEDVIKVFKDYLDKRPNRRIVKDKQEMLKHLIQGLISNPNQYVYEFIKNRPNRKYLRGESVGISEK